MYILVNTGPDCEISTTVYHNRTVGKALQSIRNSIKEAGFYDDEDLAERERLVHDFIDIAKLLPETGKNRHVVRVIVGSSNAVSTRCRPSERLDRLDSDGHRQRAKTRHRSRTGLRFWFGSSVW